jgi:hypothetical protein
LPSQPQKSEPPLDPQFVLEVQNPPPPHDRPSVAQNSPAAQLAFDAQGALPFGSGAAGTGISQVSSS